MILDFGINLKTENGTKDLICNYREGGRGGHYIVIMKPLFDVYDLHGYC